MVSQQTNVVLCHECDLPHAVVPLKRGLRALCSRCGAALYGASKDDLDRPLAFAAAGPRAGAINARADGFAFAAPTFAFAPFQMVLEDLLASPGAGEAE